MTETKLGRIQKMANDQKMVYNVMIELLKTYDYRDITVRMLCTTADISIGKFYRLFPSKESVVGYSLQIISDTFSSPSFNKELEGLDLQEQILLIISTIYKQNEEIGQQTCGVLNSLIFGVEYCQSISSATQLLLIKCIEKAIANGYVSRSNDSVLQKSNYILAIAIGCANIWQGATTYFSLEEFAFSLFKKVSDK